MSADLYLNTSTQSYNWAVVEGEHLATLLLTKSFGSNNAMNLVKATFDGLRQLRTRESVARLRGVEI